MVEGGGEKGESLSGGTEKKEPESKYLLHFADEKKTKEVRTC